MPLTFGPFLLDEAGRRLLRDGAAVPLQPKAFDLLWLLADRAGALVGHDEIHAALWPGVHLGDEALPQMVFRVRSALGDTRPYRYVEGVPRRGYRLAAPVARVGAARPGRLLGRDADFARVVAALGRPGVVVIVGAGGIGKTALAREVAARFGDAAWIDLLDATSADDVVRAAARALGVPAGERLDTLGEAVAAVIALRDGLLVVDNAEHLADEVAAHLGAWVTGASRVLVTSRRELSLDGTSIELGPLGPDEALALYEHACGAPIEPSQREDAALLVAAVDGNALAIELAGSRAAVLSPRDLLARIARDGTLRRGSGRDDDLDASVAWSFDLLGPDAQDALLSCALLAPPFEIDALEAAAGRPMLDPLQELVLHRLVRREGEGLALPAAVRFFAARRLAGAPDRGRRAAGVARWLLAGAEEALQRFEADPVADALDDLHARSEPLRRLVPEVDGDLAARCAWVAARPLLERGPYDVAFDLAARASASADPEIAVVAALALCRLSGQIDRLPAALAAAGAVLSRLDPGPAAVGLRSRLLALEASRGDDGSVEALLVLPDPGDPATAVLVHRMRGEVLGRRRRFDEAATHLRAAVAGCSDPLERASILGLLGNVTRAQGRAREAVDLYEEARAVFERAGVANDLLINLANAWSTLGEPERAIALYEASIAQARAQRSDATELLARGNLAASLAGLGRYAEALEGMRAVLFRLAGAERAERRVWALQNVGILSRYVGRAWESEAVLRDALALAVARGVTRLVEVIGPELAATLADLGRIEEAERALEAGGAPGRVAVARGHIVLARGDIDGARAAATEASALEPGSPSARALADRLSSSAA